MTTAQESREQSKKNSNWKPLEVTWITDIEGYIKRACDHGATGINYNQLLSNYDKKILEDAGYTLREFYSGAYTEISWNIVKELI